LNGDAGQDADGDGISNLDEHIGGTDPRRSDAIVLTDPRITAFTRDAPTGDIELTVTTDSGV
jgi:hypothetical protein